MYITKIHLENVRCFKDEVIDLSQCKLGNSVVIAGNNGTGKSAIIRAIAMGLCDRDSAASLLRELSGNFVRSIDDKEKANQATITVELYDPEAEEGKQKFVVETKITEYPGIIGETVQQSIFIPHLKSKDLRGKEIKIPEGLDWVIEACEDKKSGKVRQKDVAKYVPWVSTFVAGYGPGLRTSGTAKYSEYFAPDALYSIFNYSSPLQDPETAWRRLVDASRKSLENKSSEEADNAATATSEQVSMLIHGILGLEPSEQVILENNGIFVKEGKEIRGLIELDAKGDGHKSLTKVLLDILVWFLLFENYDENKQGDQRTWRPLKIKVQNGSISVPDVRGIVIIDEIEQHLHPTLQRRIIKSLSEKLPNVQFIISTHSPLCLSGTCDVPETSSHGYKIYSVFKKGNGAAIKKQELPIGLRADQILIDYFELSTTLNVTLEDDYKKLRELLLNENRSEAEDKEFRALKNKIAEIAPGLGETIKERELFISLKKSTEEIAQYMKTNVHDKNR